MNPITHCPVHSVPWKTVPGGVSKKTGRPYGEFQACPIQGCDQRPPRANGAQAAPVAASVSRPNIQPNPEANARLQAACAAWSGACAFYAGQPAAVPGFVESMAEAGYKFILACRRGQALKPADPTKDPSHPDYVPDFANEPAADANWEVG